jgi:hypothetical protein
MPLRDHFRPPVSAHSSWEGFHGGWPMTMVQHLSRQLPEDFTAEPRVHLGTYFEIDVSAYENTGNDVPGLTGASGRGGVADTDLPEQYEYEVLVYDQSRGRVLVAAVEIVSPANKDRPESRRTFVAKCAAMLQKGVCVSIVDLVTTRHFNLYADLLDLIGQSDPAFAADPPAVYAATCRGRTVGHRPRVESWAYALHVGRPLPTLPVWLTEDLAVFLDLEASYEETCRVLRIP